MAIRSVRERGGRRDAGPDYQRAVAGRRVGRDRRAPRARGRFPLQLRRAGKTGGILPKSPGTGGNARDPASATETESGGTSALGGTPGVFDGRVHMRAPTPVEDSGRATR